MCKRFNTLPRSGGILDQDHLLIRKLALVYDALDEKSQQSSSKQRKQATKGTQKGK